MNLRHNPWGYYEDENMPADMEPQFKSLADKLTPEVDTPEEFDEIISWIMENIRSLLAQWVDQKIVEKCADNAVSALNKVNESIVSPEARADAHKEIREEIAKMISSLATDAMHMSVSTDKQIQEALNTPVAWFSNESFSYKVPVNDRYYNSAV